ncbi:TRAP transporter substrate-binding protein [Arhodomonas sp. AD133]|uniref:TRAP transporter substrate-binding protein n=1 Tax=Arhodomonas sp. AD133 TaxID=3415009 RepID=UPI003EBF74DF
MKRRDFVKTAGLGAVAGAASVGAPYVHAQSPRVRWRMATSWPTSLDTIFGGAEHIAERVKELTGGRFDIRPYAGGELVGGLQVLDAVQAGTVQAGHTASYYYVGKNPALAIDTTIPFGFTARMQNAWMYQAGGIELMNDEVFSDFNIYAYPAGNTTCQMGGWFRREVPDLASLKGLKMRIPGFGGKVMDSLGVNVQTLAAAEIFPALERGVIDATEWVGPYDDEKLGFYQAAEYYYAPSWWEPSAQLSVYFNRDEFDKLPKDYQNALRVAAAESNQLMISRYDTRNPAALKRLLDKGVKLRTYSDEIMAAAQKNAFEMYEDLASENETWAKVYRQWKEFRDSQYAWYGVAEHSYTSFAVPQMDVSALIGTGE